MSTVDQAVDWSKTTFDGSRREQLARWRALSLRERMEALDRLSRQAESLRSMPGHQGDELQAMPHAVHERRTVYQERHRGHELMLGGCTPTPLANYLKALGVLRLLSEQMIGLQVTGHWDGTAFVLRSPHFSEQQDRNRQIVIDFFLDRYAPSPLVTPWNGRGGFLEGDEEEDEESFRAGALMVQLFTSDRVSTRFERLSKALKTVAETDGIAVLNRTRNALKKLKSEEKRKGKGNLSDEEKEEIRAQEKASKSAKAALLQELRNGIPDPMLDWFDACLALANDPNEPGSVKPVPAPLLGAGGLDGSMDFGVNFLKRVNDVFDPTTGRPRDQTAKWLAGALFGVVSDGLISASHQDKKKVSVGQFNPANSGGSNSQAGFSGVALLNPWDTLLQLEGAVLFASAIARRLEGQGQIYASLPYTVAPRAIGEAMTTADELPKGAKRRTAEVWLPLWGTPATYQEVKCTFREGRVTLRGKTVDNGFDFARAITELGTSRGISGFHRFAFLKRSGDAFFALDLGRYDARESPCANLVQELDGRNRFLSRIQAFVRSRTLSGEWRASTKLRTLSRRLDASLIRVLSKHDRGSLLESLTLLGQLQAEIAHLGQRRRNGDKGLAIEVRMPPVPRLSERWVQMADDGSAAFRIARALAGLRGVAEVPLPLRSQLFPLHRTFNDWAGTDDEFRVHSGVMGRLPDTLVALLSRRLWLAKRFGMADKPLASVAGATRDDVATFLRNDALDRRISELLPGLVLCDIPQDAEREAGDGVLPAAFGLLKLCLTPDATLRSLGALGETDTLPVPSGMLAQLATGNTGNRAVAAAWRRLHASGLQPAVDVHALPLLGGVSPLRAAAALMIPLRYGATGALMRNVLRPRETPLDIA